MQTNTIGKIMNLRTIFSNLPDEFERDYELYLTNMVANGEIDENILQLIINIFKDNKAEYNNIKYIQEDKIAYASFFCLNVLYRHNLDFDKLQTILDNNEDWAKQHCTFKYLQITKSVNCAEDLYGNEEDFLSYLYSFAIKHKKNAGFLHAFSNLYVNICETNQNSQTYWRKKWGNKADNTIQMAIYLDPNYALYYFTKGRIALINEDYRLAEYNIDKAISLENSFRKDNYSIRIGLYRSYKVQIQIKRSIDLPHIQEEIKHLRNINISNIEILCFFSAIITFILSSLSLINSYSPIETAALIIVLTGGLVIAFSVFNILLHLENNQNHTKKYINYFLITFGILFIVIGILFINILNQCFTINYLNYAISSFIKNIFIEVSKF